MKVTIESLPTNCANLNCRNKVFQGGFALVQIGPLQLWMCFPCARELDKQANSNGE